MIFLLLLIVILFSSNTVLGAMPTWVTDRPLNQWYSIPNTALSSVPPTPNTPPGSPAAKITAWNGAGLKRSGSVYMIGAAGGHGDYAGNEVNALALNTITPAWEQIRQPTANADYYSTRKSDEFGPCTGATISTAQFNADLRPSSTHTYNNTQFVDQRNRLFIMASPGLDMCGVPYNPIGWPYSWTYGNERSYSYSVADGDWDHPDYVPRYTMGGNFTANMTVKHQITGDIYISREGLSADGGWARWNQATNTFTNISKTNQETIYLGAAMDPTRDRILIVGDYSGNLNPRVRDLNGNIISVTFTGLGPTVLRSSNLGGYPGAIYDEVNDNFLVVGNHVSSGVIKIYRVNASTWAVDELPVTGTAPAHRQNGILNSVQYVPELGGLVIVTSYTGNAQFIRLSTTASTLVQSGSNVTSLTLTSTTTQSNAPFAVGHAFKQGDIPSGSSIVATGVSNFQASIKNTWPNGSAKYAILSGRVDLVANVPKILNLSAGADPGGTALTEANLTSTGITASIQVGSICTVNLTSLIGVTSTLSGSPGRFTPGRVRTWVSGPQMSSWIYYSRCGTDPHLTVWFEVRLFAGGAVEVLPWVENSTLNIAAPETKTAQTITFTLGGTQRFTQSIAVPHHARIPLVSGSTFSHWLGTNPAVTPKHDTAYLQASRLVPTYRGVSASNSPIFSRIIQTYTPGTQANIPHTGMGNAGYSAFIGPLPEHDMAYLSSGGDPRALASVQANAYAVGWHDINFRDELTNQPLRFSSFPNLVTGGNEWSSAGASSTNSYTPTATSTTPTRVWDTPHHPSIGYMAYLLLGRFYFSEQTQFVATAIFLQQTDTGRNNTQGILLTGAGALTTRGMAWALRSLLQAAIATPDGETLQTEFLNSIGSNITYYHTRYINSPSSPLGFVDPYGGSNLNNSIYSGTRDPYYISTWQEAWVVFAWGYAVDLNLNISTTLKNNLTAFFNWKAQTSVGMLGGNGATEYYFANAGLYTVGACPSHICNWLDGSGPFFSDWGTLHFAMIADNFDAGCSNVCTRTGNNLVGGNYPDPTSYWGNIQTGIAYAVTNGVVGALAGYNRMIGASNWNLIVSGFNDFPVWSLMPASQQDVPIPPKPSIVMNLNVGAGKTLNVGAGKTLNVGVTE